jgi:molecular chaperone DnaK
MPQVEVTFDIDANGIVNVSAKDLATGKEQGMTITGGSALPKDDIDKMMRDAEAHAEEDRQRREEAEIRNLGDTVQYNTEKFLAEHGDTIPDDKKTELQDALGELRAALGGTTLDPIKSATEKVTKLSQEIGVAMHQQAQADAAQAGGEAGATPPGAEKAASGDAGSEDVVDAEIVDEGLNEDGDRKE